MKKKFIKLMALSAIFTNLNVNANEEETECFLLGEVKLPTYYFKDGESYVNLFSQESIIDEDGHYCIEEKANNRNQLKLQVYYKNNLVLQNTIVYRGKKSTNHNITLERAMAEVTCREDSCTEPQIKKNLQSPYIKEYVDKIISRYYKKPEDVNYEKIISKMSRQDRKVRNENEKVIKKESKSNFSPLSEDMRATDYKKFTYKKSDLKKYENTFLNDNSSIEGLNTQNLSPDVIVVQWARMAFFQGNDLKKAGRFYTAEFKQKLKESGAYHKPLSFTVVYKSKAKSNTRIRSKTDEMYFKKSVKDASNTFKKQYGVVINQSPAYVNIEFIFDNGSWRMNQFDVNERYLKNLEK